MLTVARWVDRTLVSILEYLWPLVITFYTTSRCHLHYYLFTNLKNKCDPPFFFKLGKIHLEKDLPTVATQTKN